MTRPSIQLKLFAGLTPYTPDNADHIPIEPGVTVEDLLQQFDVPTAKAHLIFINGVKKTLQTALSGGERVGIFPPVAGG